MLFFAIKHALRGINRRKLKNLINMLGILIGVSLLAGVQIATDSLVNAMKETVSLRYGNADIVIQKGEYQTEFFNYSVYQNLKLDWELFPYIDGIAPRITSQVSISSILTTKQTEPFVTAIGVHPVLDKPFGDLLPDESYGNNNFNFSKLGEKECIIGWRLAESVIDFDVIGEGKNKQLVLPAVNPIEMAFLDAQGNFRFESLNVKGIAKTEGKGVLNTGFTIFMKLGYLRKLFNTTITDAINTIVVSTTKSNENAAFVKELIEKRLEFHLGDAGKKYRVDPQKLEAFKDVEDSIRNFRIVLYVFGSLIIISGVMLILNITLMNIDERERNIGILRAIGLTRRQLLISLLTESMILGGLGSLLGLGGGMLSGIGIIFLLENFLDIGEILTSIPLIVRPIGLIIAFTIGIVISLLAALYPAWKASRINIVETINEVETIQLRRKSGNWSIFLGALLAVGAIAMFALSFVITADWRWTIFLGGILAFLFGLGFVFSRLIGARIAFNLFALSWIATGLLSVLLLNPYLSRIEISEEMALYVFLIGMLAMVFGTIIFIALNLEWISNRFNDFFQKVKSLRSIGVISMRYVGKKKTRSALTFAIFGVILTTNVFLAVFTGSFTLGFDDFATNEEGGVDIIAYTPFGSSNFTNDPIQMIKETDPNIEEVISMKFRFSLSGALINLPFLGQNETHSIVEILPIPCDMWGVNDAWLGMTDYAFYEVWDGIEGDVWEAVKNESNRFIVLPGLLKEFEFDEGGITYTLKAEVGDTITINEIDPNTMTVVPGNYTIAAFIQTTTYSLLFSSFLFASENAPIFTGISNTSAFLIRTSPKLTLDEKLEVSRKVEAQLFGYDTLCLRERLKRFMEFITQSVSFMQSFVSLGLVVGVLGLIIVSLRGITERTREIGMMRAIGFQRAEVITAVVIEIFAVAFVGLVIGFINGFILGYGMYTQYLADFDFRFIIPWKMLAIFTFVTVLLSIIAAILPARRASKIPPSEALRYTG